MATLRLLGLPINYAKLVNPNTHAVWLGVTLDFQQLTVSIPRAKVDQLLQFIDSIIHLDGITYKQTQSLIGHIAHIVCVVIAARLFMVRILNLLKQSDGKIVIMNHPFMSDLKWFKVYFAAHNAKAMIPDKSITMVIEADSSLVAGGAWSGNSFYINRYSAKMSNVYSICQLEAINYLVAVRCFISHNMCGRTVEITGDNGGAIAAISSGRACDVVLAAVARALWYHAAARDVHLVFTHRPGHLIPVADALSRAPISSSDNDKAQRYISDMGLLRKKISPNMQNFEKYL